jgi:DNA-binding NtrC family response regulator
MDGIELLEVIRNCSPRTECIMVTAIDEARVAVQSLRKGAYDYLVKPISKENLISTLNRAIERRRLFDILDLSKTRKIPKLHNEAAFKPIITRSVEMLRILKEAELHAASDVPILITGETGTGKELLARAIHEASNRGKNKFTAINMDSLSIICLMPNSSGTPGVHLPVRRKSARGIWNIQTKVRSFWMKSATCGLNSRVNCCVFCRKVNL